MTHPAAPTSLSSLTAAIETEPTLDARLEVLLRGLAERIKATSNDQNIQKLSRDLRAAAPALASAVAREPART